MMCVYGVGVWVCQHHKTKTTAQDDLKLGTVVVLNTVLKSIDLGFKRSRVNIMVKVIASPESRHTLPSSSYSF